MSNTNKYRAGDIFFSRDNSLTSKLIRIKTLSNWSHCGIILNKTYVVSATIKGVVEEPIDNYPIRQVLMLKGISNEIREKIVILARYQVGKKYDFCGLASFLLFKKLGSKDRWFCSEFVNEIYKRAGIDLFDGRKDGAFVSPADLYENPKLKLVEG